LVLIANDQEWSARSLESILGPHGYAVLRAYTGRQALEFARSAQPDLLIVDSRLPDMDGVDLCRELREDGQLSVSTPVVITTSGPGSRAERLAAYEAGAWEFCSQPLDGEALLLKLDNFVKAKRALDRARDDSLLDRITGLYNMRGLAQRAREMGAEAHRRHEPLACVALATEEPGPAYSDQPSDGQATEIAEHLSAIFRRTGRMSDAIGRLGQTEFAIIAPATEAAGVMRLVERLKLAIEEAPLAVDGQRRSLVLRVGYATVADFAESSVDAVELLLRAAAALRHVRADGGAHVTAFEDVPAKLVQ
jgi:diguanylate cyclase (GGDEF)-like protein